jgi:hypothetical protein
MPDRGAFRRPFVSVGPDLAALEISAPSDDMRAGYNPEFLGTRDAGEAHEITDRVFVGALCAEVFDVGKPFDYRGHVGQILKLCSSEASFAGGDLGRELVGHSSSWFRFAMGASCRSKRRSWLQSASRPHGSWVHLPTSTQMIQPYQREREEPAHTECLQLWRSL